MSNQAIPTREIDCIASRIYKQCDTLASYGHHGHAAAIRQHVEALRVDRAARAMYRTWVGFDQEPVETRMALCRRIAEAAINAADLMPGDGAEKTKTTGEERT